ncbi:MAG TPA: hypothetical protein VL335_02025 [Candidatus Paceibacterota bacterium]|nr:hypothetical protein [Candidatus Paceibacterota bacterium]
MNFFMKALLKKQLKGVPEAEIEKFVAMVEKNPDFFKQVAEEAQAKIKAGMGQQEAVMAVLADKQEELAKVVGK